jgi:hypothetical protein
LIKRGISEECDEEALPVTSNMPSWTPEQKDGKKVSVNHVIPIRFALS